MMDTIDIGAGALIASAVAGFGLGLYFSKLHYFQRPRCSWKSQFVTLVTIGMSFLLPLAVEQVFFETARMGIGEWLAVFGLWVIFSGMAVLSNSAMSNKPNAGDR